MSADQQVGHVRKENTIKGWIPDWPPGSCAWGLWQWKGPRLYLGLGYFLAGPVKSKQDPILRNTGITRLVIKTGI